ncbi:MAG: TetR/AcrR family transcriptional regulator [Pseudomonadota bacterium]
MVETLSDAQMTEKKPYHHGDLRHALIEAAKDLVETKGAAHFSVAQAARVAGVSSGAPYRHFKDRDEMLDAVAKDGLQRLAQRFVVAADPFEEGSVEAITAIGIAYVDFAKAQPGVFRLMFAELRSESDETCAAGEACKMQLLRHVGAHLGHDTIGDATHDAAFPLWTMVHGISFLMIDGKVPAEELDVPLDKMLSDCTRRLLAR